MMRRRTEPALCQAVHRHQPDRPRNAADGLNLCPGCHTSLNRNLAALPGLHAEVLDSLPASGDQTSTTVSGTPTQPLPYNPRAGNLLNQIGHDLAWLVHLVADERGIKAQPAPHPAAMSIWLGRHVDWLAAHPEAGPIKDTLTELVARAYNVIDPARQPLTIGPCTETVEHQPCEGTVRATVRRDGDPAPSIIWCDTCQLELDTTQWHRFGKRYLAQRERIAG